MRLTKNESYLQQSTNSDNHGNVTAATLDGHGSLIENKLLNYKQASNFLGISPKSLQRLKLANNIPYVEIGGAVRFRPSSLNAWIKRREIS